MKALKNNRYAGLMISLLLLVTILSAGFAVSYQWSKRNAQILDGANYVGDMSDAMLHIAARANHLVILDDSEQAKRQQLLEEITRYHAQAEENLNNMFHDKNMSAVPNLQAKMRILADVWRQYNEKILRLKLDDRRYDRDLANFVYTRLEPNHEVILELYYDYFDESYQLIRKSNYVQIGLALFSFVYFILLILVYFKRFIRRDEELNIMQKEMQEIMETVDSGLFLLEKDLSIGQLQSHRLSVFLGYDDLTGVSLIKALQKISKDSELIRSTQEFIEQLYNPKVKEKLIESLNPLDHFQSALSGESRYLSFHFKRVYREQEIIKVLVNVRDITSEVLLEQQQKEERHKNDHYLLMLRAIQTADRAIIHDFMVRVKESCVDINQMLREQVTAPLELRSKLEKIWRLVHSIKGEASALKLKAFQDLAERFEEELKVKQQEHHLTGKHFFGLVVYLDELMNLTQLMSGLLGVGAASLEHFDLGVAPETQNDAEAHYYQNFVQDLAQRQGKDVDCVVQGMEQVHDGDLRRVMREIAVQMVRNAVVHGIEKAEIRSALGKLPTGRVRLVLRAEQENWHLMIEDDGQGLNYEAIRRKAVALGWYSAEQAQALDNKALLALIFRAQFSTAEQADEDAGRGVGLDIVKHTVQQHGGRLKVSSQAQRYTRFSFYFPISHS